MFPFRKVGPINILLYQSLEYIHILALQKQPDMMKRMVPDMLIISLLLSSYNELKSMLC